MSNAGPRLAWTILRLFLDPWRDRKDRELERWAAQARALEEGPADPDREAAAHRARAEALRQELAELRGRADQRALLPFGRRIRPGPRRRKAPP